MNGQRALAVLKMKKWGRNKGVAHFYVSYTTGELWRNCDADVQTLRINHSVVMTNRKSVVTDPDLLSPNKKGRHGLGDQKRLGFITLEE
ncbi:hypothetical protein [Lacticaseibacillus manihotivorans]|uniref:hypothetical protein n=1 Tax=Lacticaseibacillus manihotivorans TaxID=88233 RepID=UPI0006D2537A|nr:hypothetical protein [Lacticaseibacillus manihotivorans]